MRQFLPQIYFYTDFIQEYNNSVNNSTAINQSQPNANNVAILDDLNYHH